MEEILLKMLWQILIYKVKCSDIDITFTSFKRKLYAYLLESNMDMTFLKF